MESTNVPMSKRLIGIALAAVFIVGSIFVPGSETLGHEGVMTLGLLLALVSLWVTSALPLGVTALFIIVMCPVLGIVGGLGQAIGGFASPALFFIIAVFSLPVIMLKTNWGTRLIGALIKWTGSNSRKLVLGFMIATTLVSTIMSDVPCTVLFLGFALAILKAANAKPLESNLGRCLMIGIPISAVTGGMATPAGSSFNVVAMNILQKATGASVSFLDWVIVALIGLTVMFLPGMQLLSWKEFQDAVPWGIVLMCGTIMSLGSVIESTGGAAFLAGLITNSGVMSLSSFAALALMLAFVYILHTVCPIGVAILGIFLPIMITLCAGFGMSPAVPTIALAVVVAGNYLMPVNPTVMLTYGEGYYTFGDMFKTGIIPSIVLVLLMAAWMPFIVGVLGI